MDSEKSRETIDAARRRARETIHAAEEARSRRLADMISGSPEGEAMSVPDALARLRSEDRD